MKKVISYISEFAKALNKADLFDHFWNIERTWFEPPNLQRGGMEDGLSGAIKHQLVLNDTVYPVFVKIQSNSIFRSYGNCYKPCPTFFREFTATYQAQQAGVNTPDIIYYGEKGLKAIFVTHSLEDHQSLDLVFPYQPTAIRHKILEQLGQNLCRLHKTRRAHLALFPKHVLVKIENDTVDVRLIDFEKSKRRLTRYKALFEDLERLFRRADFLSYQDQEILLKAYQQALPAWQYKRLHKKLIQTVIKNLAKKKVI